MPYCYKSITFYPIYPFSRLIYFLKNKKTDNSTTTDKSLIYMPYYIEQTLTN